RAAKRRHGEPERSHSMCRPLSSILIPRLRSDTRTHRIAKSSGRRPPGQRAMWRAGPPGVRGWSIRRKRHARTCCPRILGKALESLGGLLVRVARGIDGVPQVLEALTLDVAGRLVCLEEVEGMLVVGDLGDAGAALGGAQQVCLRSGA